MKTERTFSEQEVREILELATAAQSSSSLGADPREGMTLAQLHEIGDEVGISKELITRAANRLEHDSPDPGAHRSLLGLTIGLGRTVELPRRLTDEEWSRLVVDLRMTFDAKGKIREEGVFRQWTNGNLQALLEPSGSGERLRLRTRKGSATTYTAVGLGMMGLATLRFVAGVLTGDPADVESLFTIAAVGAAFFASTRITVPSWARTRASQMEAVIARLESSLEE